MSLKLLARIWRTLVIAAVLVACLISQRTTEAVLLGMIMLMDIFFLSKSSEHFSKSKKIFVIATSLVAITAIICDITTILINKTTPIATVINSFILFIATVPPNTLNSKSQGSSITVGIVFALISLSAPVTGWDVLLPVHMLLVRILLDIILIAPLDECAVDTSLFSVIAGPITAITVLYTYKLGIDNGSYTASMAMAFYVLLFVIAFISLINVHEMGRILISVFVGTCVLAMATGPNTLVLIDLSQQNWVKVGVISSLAILVLWCLKYALEQRAIMKQKSRIAN